MRYFLTIYRNDPRLGAILIAWSILFSLWFAGTGTGSSWYEAVPALNPIVQMWLPMISFALFGATHNSEKYAPFAILTVIMTVSAATYALVQFFKIVLMYGYGFNTFITYTISKLFPTFGSLSFPFLVGLFIGNMIHGISIRRR